MLPWLSAALTAAVRETTQPPPFRSRPWAAIDPTGGRWQRAGDGGVHEFEEDFGPDRCADLGLASPGRPLSRAPHRLGRPGSRRNLDQLLADRAGASGRR